MLASACELPSRADLVGRRARARMSANELHNLGRDALLIRDYGTCAETMRAVLRKKRLPEAYGHLALCAAAEGRPDEARAALEAAPEGPARARARVLLAVARGDLEGARAALTQVSEAVRPELEAVFHDGRVGPEAWAAASFGNVPTPRQAPRGIMGN